MTDILFGNNNRPVLKLLAKRSLKAQKNTIAVLAIMLATLLFTSLFTIAISLQTAMQESNMRTTGTSAHAGIKRLSWEEYEKLSSDTGIKDIGYSIIIGNAVGDDFNAFAALPKQEQSILILFCVLELGDGEIGDLMGMSRSAVQRHRAKTLNELRKKLKAHLPEGG